MDSARPHQKQPQAFWAKATAGPYGVTVALYASSTADAAERSLRALLHEFPSAAAHPARVAVYSYERLLLRRPRRQLLFVMHTPPTER